MIRPNIAVIGGGCAGLSAAAYLVDKNYSVTLFEATPHLGGRARTVLVEHNSLMNVLDNGQHILVGAYHETLALLSKVGVHEHEAFLRLPLLIRMHSSAEKPDFLLKSEHLLPAPFNLLFGLFGCEGLTFSERASAIKLMAQLKLSGYQIAVDNFLESYLIEKKQSPKLIEFLWEPLCLAALNTPIAVASTRVFFNVLRDTFTGSKKNSDFLLPKADLSKILATPLTQYIQENGGSVQLNQQVRKLETSGDQFIVSSKEKSAQFSHVIVATPPANLAKLLSNFNQLNNVLSQTEAFGYQPIYTVYIQYPANILLPHVMTGFTKKLSQWAFDRGQLCGQKGLVAVVLSGTGAHQQLSHDELALKVANELHQTFHHLPKPLWHKVIAEKRATFSCVPNLARPPHKTDLPNLFLAGDYTYAPYPSTIEGAVRSGIACAKLVENSL